MLFKSALPLKASALAITLLTSLLPLKAAHAQSLFGEEPISNDMAAIAVPLRSGTYGFIVVEQIPDQQDCWSESGSNPTIVDPLLLTFDFTGSCKRSTDGNGYSIRVDGQDLGLQYSLRVAQVGNELLLIGTPSDRSKPEMIVGRSGGLATGYLKMSLLPGWRFTRRTFEDKALGHYYLSGTGSQIIALDGSPLPELPRPSTDFTDIANDIYRTEIEQAVTVGFIAGFEDKTFRPNDALTREQLVSMVIEALAAIPNTSIQVPTSISAATFPDVEASRWSAAKIAWAQENEIVTGYPNGEFRPAQAVTRAELLAVLRRAAEFGKQAQGQAKTLTATQDSVTFTDTEGHWAEDLAMQMSAFCGVASPYQEQGNNFLPNTEAQRNYAAAATLRTLNCVAP